jgi:hypothetical protein
MSQAFPGESRAPRWSVGEQSTPPSSIAELLDSGARVGVGPPLLPSGPGRGSSGVPGISIRLLVIELPALLEIFAESKCMWSSFVPPSLEGFRGVVEKSCRAIGARISIGNMTPMMPANDLRVWLFRASRIDPCPSYCSTKHHNMTPHPRHCCDASLDCISIRIKSEVKKVTEFS